MACLYQESGLAHMLLVRWAFKLQNTNRARRWSTFRLCWSLIQCTNHTQRMRRLKLHSLRAGLTLSANLGLLDKTGDRVMWLPARCVSCKGNSARRLQARTTSFGCRKFHRKTRRLAKGYRAGILKGWAARNRGCNGCRTMLTDSKQISTDRERRADKILLSTKGRGICWLLRRG
jgi:hypothetical protein